jgi:hypothetical protein
MKLSSGEAFVIARVLERYYIYASRFMEKGFGTHPEMRNTNLFIETAEDLTVISKLYPAFAGGKTIAAAVQERTDITTLPDPTRITKTVDQPFKSLLDEYPGLSGEQHE